MATVSAQSQMLTQIRQVRVRPLVVGAATLLPGLSSFYRHCLEMRGAKRRSAAHSYGVWLRHVIAAHRNGLWNSPRVVAEIGPGSSFGAGLAALLSGAEQYRALDVVNLSKDAQNLKVFDELVELFVRRADIPDRPDLVPSTESRKFPSHILTDALLRDSLDPERLAQIRRSLADIRRNDGILRYDSPWTSPSVIEPGSVDMIFSLAVMEHVEDPVAVHGAAYEWLRPGGFVSHRIDYRCHRCAQDWNGHWTYSDFVWKLIKGRKPFLLNRLPHSAQMDALRAVGFEQIWEETREIPSALCANDLAPKFRNLNETDLHTSDGAIQAAKL